MLGLLWALVLTSCSNDLGLDELTFLCDSDTDCAEGYHCTPAGGTDEKGICTSGDPGNDVPSTHVDTTPDQAVDTDPGSISDPGPSLSCPTDAECPKIGSFQAITETCHIKEIEEQVLGFSERDGDGIEISCTTKMKTRECGDDCTWGEWGDFGPCTVDPDLDGGCLPRQIDCVYDVQCECNKNDDPDCSPFPGRQKQQCNNKCQWLPLDDQCKPESDNGGCTRCGTVSEECITEEIVQNQECDGTGTQYRSCDVDECSWEPWGTCQ